jgi:L-arabinose isomerase
MMVNKKPKIGLLTGGYFEYWKMYPGLEQEVEKEMRDLAESLGSKMDIVWSGLADTQEKCDAAGKKFQKEQIDLLVICEGTYFPDYMPVQTAEYVPNAPILVLLTQPQDHVPEQMDYRDAIHHSFGVVGAVQLTGAFRKMGKPFEIIVGALNDPALPGRVEDYARVALLARELRFLNLGIIGHTFRGMYDLELDKTMLKSAIGPTVVYIELGELLSIWKEMDPKAAEALTADVLKTYRLDGPDRQDLCKACRLGLAMETLAERYQLDGLAHLCQHLIHVETETTPCYANTRLIEKGIMVTCEGDIGNLVAMCILHRLTGRVAYQGEWGMFDVPRNAMLFVHHGAGSPTLAKSPADVRITPTGEKWGFTGQGASFRYTGKPGPVTLCSLICDRDGWKMLITGGEVIDSPCRPYWGEQFTIRTERPVTEYLADLCREGVTHHAAMVYGDVRPQLEHLADLLRLRKFIL